MSLGLGGVSLRNYLRTVFTRFFSRRLRRMTSSACDKGK